jgi:RNA polymerase sigma-70 factor (ECF subfamily)
MATAGNSSTLLGAERDFVLVERTLGGDASAFEELVHGHERLLNSVTMSITSNRQDAEEATQDAFLKAYQHLGEFQRRSKFSTWLIRIAVNEALQKCRRRKATKSLDDLTENEDGTLLQNQLGDSNCDPEMICRKEEIREDVERSIRSLTPVYRETFVLRDVQGLTTEEAAEVLGISSPAVKSRLQRARLKMRETLAAHCGYAPVSCLQAGRHKRAVAQTREWIRPRQCNEEAHNNERGDVDPIAPLPALTPRRRNGVAAPGRPRVGVRLLIRLPSRRNS